MPSTTRDYHQAVFRSLSRLLGITVLLLIASTATVAQQGTLSANTTFPVSTNSLVVQGAASPDGASIALVKFAVTPNLPQATAGSYVSKATLTLFVQSLNAAGAFNVYRVTNDWNEGDASAPAYDLANPIASGVSVTSVNSFVTVDLTDLVRQWLGTDGAGASGFPNYGIALVASDANSSFAFERKGGTPGSHTASLAVLLNRAASSAAVDNGVYTSGDQTIEGNKTFANPIIGSVTGSAASAAVAGTTTGLTSAAQDTDIGSPVDGQVYYNTTLNLLRRFDGATSTWKSIDAGSAVALSPSATLNAAQVTGELTNATIPGM